MPIYEFECESCRNQFETLVFKSDEVIACPSCKGTDVHKLMSACSFSSKGSDGSVKTSAADSSCAGCTAGSCSSCH